MRINKYIAHAGIASRRKAEELIRQGKVSINGQVVCELATNVKSGDRVEVDEMNDKLEFIQKEMMKIWQQLK